VFSGGGEISWVGSCFWWGGGDGGGLGGGGLLVIFLQIGEGQTCFIRNRGGVSFFGKEKITPCRLVDSYLLTNTRNV